jgi:hypothetical protein
MLRGAHQSRPAGGVTAPVQYGPRAAALKGSATTQERVRATLSTVVRATVCRHGV